MSFTVFLGNLPIWVTADDIKSWLAAENLVADQIKVIRNPETQESKGFAFIDAPNNDEMQAIIRRFDRAPLEDRLLRANPAQPPKTRRPGGPPMGVPAVAESRPAAVASQAPPAGQTHGQAQGAAAGQGQPAGAAQGQGPVVQRKRRERDRRRGKQGPQSDFAEQLAKAL